jgi:serine/threonine protein kinase
MAADRDLLFGLLALQVGLIDQGQLVAAFQAWAHDRDRGLADHLAARGDLDPDQRAAVEAMAALHVKKYGGDPEKSLAAIPAGPSTRERLAALGDPELTGTVAHLGSGSTEPYADRTATYAVGAATSDGQRFRVLRPHARGGLGAVFVAVDEELHREVALKQILDDRADDPVSRQRFLVEAEVTGGLEHPGIVPVYGLGAYGDGRPFYAMRFIKGDSLKEAIAAFHADDSLKRDPGQRSLELRKLLRRFLDVCNAIDYAHARGVLHRDLKPGNVIVGRYGETLVVDWGLAKATGRRDPEATPGERTLTPASSGSGAETLPGQVLGTPGYMSPEQAAGELDRLGPASDVYSLGATLYCLLTGRAPFEGEAGDVLRRGQKGDYPPPRSLEAQIDRALEAVCLKAMALRAEHRYASCRALADDVEHWLADEPVSAWQEPLADRVRRWMRRHRIVMASAMASLVVALLGTGVVLAVQTQANAKLRDANATVTRALVETGKAKQETEKALGESEESRKQAEAVSTFLVESFRSPDPSLDGRTIKVADLLDRAAEKLDKEFTGTTETKGALLNALGRTYDGLGLYDKAGATHMKAGAVLEAALGPDHADTLTSRNNLALAYRAAGRIAEAIALHETTLKLRESKLGPDHSETLVSRNDLANAYRAAGRTADAIRLHEETLKLFESKLGPDDPETLGSRNNLALAYYVDGRTAQAIALLERTRELLESKLGPDHPNTLRSRNNLAAAYLAAGRTAEAIRMNEETLEMRESKLGPDHPDTLSSRGNLAEAYRAAGRTAEAIALHETTVKLKETKVGLDHPDTLISRGNLARAYESLGRWTKAEVLWRDNLERRRKATKPNSPLLADELRRLGRNLLNQSRWSDAEPILRECLAIHEKALPDDWLRFDAVSLLGGALAGQGRHAEAEPLVVQGFEGMKAREARIPALGRPLLAEAAERVVQLYEAWDKPGEAKAWAVKLGLADLPDDVFARP